VTNTSSSAIDPIAAAQVPTPSSSNTPSASSIQGSSAATTSTVAGGSRS
jgi:hypothetical protein